jgi:hypothetical protein
MLLCWRHNSQITEEGHGGGGGGGDLRKEKECFDVMTTKEVSPWLVR